MSKFDKYRQSKPLASTSKFDKYRVPNSATNTELPEKEYLVKTLGKSLLKGATSIADLPKIAATGIEGLSNLHTKYYSNPIRKLIDIPEATETNYSDYIPDTHDARKYIKDKLDIDLEPHPADGTARILGNAAEWVAPGGIIGKFAKAKLLKEAAKGAGIGAASGVLQETGVNPLAADLTAIVGQPLSVGALKKIPKIGKGAIGLSPDKLKLNTAKAYKDLDIDVTAPLISESSIPSIAETYLGKAPIVGTQIAKKYQKINNQVQEAINKTLDIQSPKRTKELEKTLNNNYDKIAGTLTSKDKIVPINLLDSLDKIDVTSASNSSAEKALLKVQKDLKKAFDIKANKKLKGINPNLISPQEVEVKELWKVKKSLNSMIKDKDFGDVRNLLKNVRAGINKDLEEFANLNPEWGKLYKDTDVAYSKLKGRDTLQNLFIDTPTNFGSETYSYNKLANNIKNPESLRKIELAVKNDPKLLERIEKLGVVASSYGNKIARNPNPSGTAGTAAVLSYLVGGKGLSIAPTTTITTAGIGFALTQGLINKKFLDAAISYAEKPNIANTMKFNAAIKKLTGLSALAVAKELNLISD